jgi:hypothetical protein
MPAVAWQQPVREVVIPYAPRPYQRRVHELMESHRFTVFILHRRFGKTVAAVNHLIKQAILNERQSPPPRFSYIAPYRNQAKEIAWDYLKRFTAPIPGVVVSETELRITLPNRAQIRLLGADHPEAIRGVYLDGVVLDEVADMRPDVWGSVVRPMLGDFRGWAVFIGTLKRETLLTDLYFQALDDRSGEWAAAMWTAEETGVVPASELEQMRREMGEAQYRREMLCDMTVGEDDTLIDFFAVQAAARRLLSPLVYRHAAKILSVDVAHGGGDLSACVRRQGAQVSGLKTWDIDDMMTLAGLVAEEIKDYAPDVVVVDGGGMGVGLIDALRSWGYTVTSINGASRAHDDGRYRNLRAEMWDRLRQWIRDEVSIPNDPHLRADLLAQRYKIDANGRMQLESKQEMKKRGRPSPDRGDALAMTFAVQPAPPDRRVITLDAPQDDSDDYDPLTWGLPQ